MSHQIHLFAYGTLMIPSMVRQLIEREVSSIPGRLDGYACYEVKHQIYPAIVAAHESNVSGVIYKNLSEEDLEKLDVYEGDMYERTCVEVKITDGRLISCQTYVCRAEYLSYLDNKLWNPSRISPEGLSDLMH